MRSWLQHALVRWAAGLLWLAARFSRRGAVVPDARGLFGLAAGRALKDARGPERAEPREPKGAATASSPKRPSTSPPDGYCAMVARTHLPSSFGSALLLADEAEEQFVPVFVGSTEALSFDHRIGGRRFRRPLTHDLFDALLDEIGAALREVRIEELRDNAFIATVVVVLTDERAVELDARASDAIVLAVGCDAPIYVAERVLEQAGRPVAGLDEGALDPDRRA